MLSDGSRRAQLGDMRMRLGCMTAERAASEGAKYMKIVSTYLHVLSYSNSMDDILQLAVSIRTQSTTGTQV